VSAGSKVVSPSVVETTPLMVSLPLLSRSPGTLSISSVSLATQCAPIFLFYNALSASPTPAGAATDSIPTLGLKIDLGDP
jgi:hypothetical protein